MDFVAILSIFALACFVGYYVVWSVTPALHTPLMAVTTAISSVIGVGALFALSAFRNEDKGRPLLDMQIGEAIRLTKHGAAVHERMIG